MQNEIKAQSQLLDGNGVLKNPGWARDLVLNYDRRAIKAPKFKIKEWDYYCVLAGDYGAAFTIADNGYLGFVSITLFDFKKPEEITKTAMTLFPMGSFGMPASSKNGEAAFDNSDLSLRFLRESGRRTILVECRNFKKGSPLSGKIILSQPEDMDSMVIATPFPGNTHAFYYNQKINCMPAEGEITFAGKRYLFEKKRSFGVLDWGRGVWTYSNTWYWGSGSGIVGGEPFGFNIGYGFGDTSAATENMLFYKHRAHKLDHVTFHIPGDSFTKPWRFSSSDGRFEMDFLPILDRYSNTNLLFLKSEQHQVFGRFSGTAVLDNGKKLVLDDFLGFAEKVINRW